MLLSWYFFQNKALFQHLEQDNYLARTSIGGHKCRQAGGGRWYFTQDIQRWAKVCTLQLFIRENVWRLGDQPSWFLKVSIYSLIFILYFNLFITFIETYAQDILHQNMTVMQNFASFNIIWIKQMRKINESYFRAARELIPGPMLKLSRTAKNFSLLLAIATKVGPCHHCNLNLFLWKTSSIFFNWKTTSIICKYNNLNIHVNERRP